MKLQNFPRLLPQLPIPSHRAWILSNLNLLARCNLILRVWLTKIRSKKILITRRIVHMPNYRKIISLFSILTVKTKNKGFSGTKQGPK